MFKNNKKPYFSIIFLFLAFFIIPFFIQKNNLKSSIIHPLSVKKNTELIVVSAGNKTINLSLPPNTILYDALLQGRKEGKITFSGRNYPGLGFFVTDIESLHPGNGKNLFYYINGKEATVGVSSYLLKNGDIVEWKLK